MSLKSAESTMRLASMAGNSMAFETGAENFVQELFGVVGRWRDLFPRWSSEEAMRLYKENEGDCGARMARELVLPEKSSP